MFKPFLFLGAAVAAVVLPSTAPNPSQVSIQSISYGGTGCPTGSVGQFLSSDLSTFTLIFSQFAAQVDPTTQPMDAYKFCQINLNLHYPQGFQLSVLNTEFRGYVGLDSGVNATLGALYYFSGPDSSEVRTSTVFHGPDLNSYDVDSAVGFASLVWSECGANWPLNIEASVTVASNNPSEHAGFIENDSADGSIKFIAGIQWRGC